MICSEHFKRFNENSVQLLGDGQLPSLMGVPESPHWSKGVQSTWLRGVDVVGVPMQWISIGTIHGTFLLQQETFGSHGVHE